MLTIALLAISAIELASRADRLRVEQKYAEAEVAYREALNAAEGKEAARISNNLAFVLHVQAKYGEAQHFYARTLDLYEPGDRLLRATALHNLSEAYRSEGKWELAEKFLLLSIEIREAVLGLQHSALANSYNGLACLRTDQGRLAEAETLLLKAQALRLNTPEDTALAGIFHNLAEVYRQMKRWDAAEPLYKRALHIRAALLGKEHIEYASSLTGLALLYQDTKQLPQAAEALKLAMGIRVASIGANHPSVAFAANSLAGIENASGNFSAARGYAQEAVRIWEQHPQRSQKNIAVASMNLAQACVGSRDFVSAEPAYRRAIALLELADSRSELLKQGLFELALVFSWQARLASAEKLLQQALSILTVNDAQTNPLIRDQLASVYRMQKRFTEAEKISRR